MVRHFGTISSLTDVVPSIGAPFPETERYDYTRRSLVAGIVLYLSCPFIDPPKEKYVIAAAIGDPPLLILVNSRIHPFIQSRPLLLECQVSLAVSKYPFLRHDSYANCASVFDEMPEKEVLEQLATDPKRIIMRLDPESRKQILSAVGKARTVSPSHARRILESLSESD